MRNLNFDLKNKDDVERMVNYAMLADKMAESKYTNTSRNVISDMYVLRLSHLEVALWCCSCEDENYALMALETYMNKMHELRRLGMIDHYLWEDCLLDELESDFAPPTLPTNLEKDYPGAEYSDDLLSWSYPCRDDWDRTMLQKEIDWYGRWYPRREYARKIYDIIKSKASL